MATTDQYSTVIGEAFNIKPAGNVEARNFAVRSFVTGNIVNCTLWDSSHSHVDLANGDPVIVNGKVNKTPKKDGDGFWTNVSVSKIAVIPMDSGIDTRTTVEGSRSAADDQPDVM